MLLRINPSLSVLWRSPETLQFGAPRPVAIVDVGAEWELDVVQALRIGVPFEALRRIAVERGGPEGTLRLDILLASIERALQPSAHVGVDAPRIALIGPEELCARFGASLRGLGIAESADAELAVIVTHFLVPPTMVQPLLAEDLPHIAVLCDDETIRVSPIVVPGETACTRCIELYRSDRDSAWPTLAAQLLRRRSRSSSTLLLAAAAVEVGVAITAWASAGHLRRELTTLGLGSIRRVRLEPHPHCGCATPLQIETPTAIRALQTPPSSPEAHAALG